MFESIKRITKSLLLSHTSHPRVVLGLSGGPDSVFLFFVLKALHEEKALELICAHLDHGWRQESADDATFCKQLCNKHNIPVINSHIEKLALKPKFNGSREELGRTYRRHFFENTRQSLSADLILLAHHRQDQQETFFLRLLRGSSLAGLVSMKPIDGAYARPLLNIDKNTILEWLHNNNIRYLTDHTNSTDDYLRNRIRKYIIPACNTCDGRFDQKFESTLKNLRAEHDYLNTLTQRTYEETFTGKSHVRGTLSTFRALDDVLKKRVLLLWLIKEDVPFDVSAGFINEISRFLHHTSGGTHTLNPRWQINKKQNQFWISKSTDTQLKQVN